MAQVLRDIESKPASAVEIVMHITETLGEQQRKELIADLEKQNSVISAEFCPIHYHLILVRYDRDMASSQDVLSRVKSQNYDARLIGPM